MKIKASLYNYLFNTVNILFAIVNGILMVPLYLHYMDISDYGAWLASSSVISFAGILEAGFGGVITQRMIAAEQQNDKQFFRKLSLANILIAFTIAVSITLLGLCLSPFIPTWVNANKSLYHDLTLGIILSSFSAGLTVFGAQIGVFPQVWQDTFYMGIINTVSIAFGIITIYVSLIHGWGVASIGLGYLVRNLVNCITMSLYVIKEWHKKQIELPLYSKTVLKNLAYDCFLPFLAKISATVLNNSQNFLIASNISPVMAAIYDVTGKVISTSRIFISNINGSIFGSFSFIFASDDITYKRNNFHKLDLVHFTILTLAMSMAYLFSYDIIGFWVGKDKFGGYPLLLLILVSIFISERKALFNTLITTMGMIKQAAMLDIVNTILYMLFLMVLLRFKFGIYAMPLAIILSSLYFLYQYQKLLLQELLLGFKNQYIDGLKHLTYAIGMTIIAYYIFPFQKNIGEILVYAIFYFIFYFIALLIFNQSLRNMCYPYLNFLIKKLR